MRARGAAVLRSRHWRVHQREEGQVLILTALVFVFLMVTLLVVVADLLVMIDASARARSAAYAGAVAGGQTVDPAAVSGTLSGAGPLGAAAPDVCRQDAQLADAEASASCSVSGNVMTATVCQRVAYPVALLGVGGQVCDTERAGAAFGTVRAGGGH